jgi:hypothetical protein
MPETKKCDACDQEIGASEKVCPKCEVDFEELEDAVATVSKAQEVIERRKAATAEKDKKNEPKPTGNKKPLRSLGSILRKAGKK